MKDKSNKQWGGRFAEGSSAIMEKINASIDIDVRFAQQDVQGSISHVTMLGKQGIIPPEEAEVIAENLAEIAQELKEGKIAFKTELEDIHTHIEHRLKEKIGNVAGKLHTARSRNDQVVTDFRLWLRDQIDQIAVDIKLLCSAIVHVSEQHTETLMAGLTHMQVAQPVSFAQHMMAYAQMLRRDYGRLSDCRKRLNECPLGSAALAGTAFPIDRELTAKALGFDAPMENSMDGVSARDFAMEFLAFASILSVHLSRLAEEMVLWNSSHIGYITFSDAFSTGSSIMPQKRNPDAAELVRAKPSRVMGHLMSLLSLVKALPLTYAKDLQEDKEPVFDAVDTLKLTLAAMQGMVQDMTVKPETMLEKLQAGFPTATDLADWLVGEKKLTFREAHHISGSIVKLAEENGIDISELRLDQMQEISSHIDQGVFSVLSLEASLHSRNSAGGVAPSAVKQQIKKYQQDFLTP